MPRVSGKAWLAALTALLLLGVLLGISYGSGTRTRVFTWQLAVDNDSGPLPLDPGESHEYRFVLETRDYLELSIEQIGLDVEVSLEDPNDNQLILADSWIGARGPEVVMVVATQPGSYRLVITSDQEKTGHYGLHVDTFRPATPRDQDRAAAAAEFSEAEKLRRHNDPAAITRYQTAADLWRDSGDLLWQAIAIGQIGWVYDLSPDRHSARDYYLQALKLFESASQNKDSEQQSSDVRSRHQEIFILLRLAWQQKRLGELQQAKISYLKAEELAQELGEERLQATCLSNLGGLHRTLGETSLAIGHYEQALSVLHSLNEPETESLTLSNIAQLYISLGDLDSAEETLQEALQLSETAKSRKAQARALRALGDLEHRRDRLQISLGYLRRALELDRELKNRDNQGSTTRSLGWIYYKLCAEAGAPYGELAIDSYKEALEIFRERDDTPAIARALTELGWVIFEVRDDPQAALTYQKSALKLFRQIEDRSGEASALYTAARAERRLGRLPAAQASIQEAIDIVESLRVRTDEIGFRTTYFASKQDYYELAIELSVELGEPIKALETSERRRARALLDILEHTLTFDDAAESSEHDISPESSSGPGTLAAGNRFDTFPALDLLSIQELLDEQTILLKYSLGMERSFLWLVTPTEIEIHELPEASVIDSLARKAHRLLVDGHGHWRQGQRELVTHRLSSMLLGEVASRLNSKRLLIVPEAALQYVPFGALPVPGADNADLMVARHEIVYIPSLSILRFLRRQADERPLPPLTLAVVADPIFNTGSGFARLPATREEAQSLLDLVPDDESLALLGHDASRERVLSGELADFRYVHFATHGLFDRESPDLSGLMLSEVDSEGRQVNGFLRTPEIYRSLRLPADMVVLSACRTGLGEEVRGEGLVGLAQSIFYAGTARVIASYWEVGDSATAELMHRVYRGIFQEKLPPATALHRAQLSMYREPRWRAPHYWAGFFLQGEWQ